MSFLRLERREARWTNDSTSSTTLGANEAPAASASWPICAGAPSRELLDRALAGLAAVGHRGAWAADGVTGDGAGVLVPLSAAITGNGGAGVAMCFLREGWLRSAVEDACRAEGLEPAGWREVPTRTRCARRHRSRVAAQDRAAPARPSDFPTPSAARIVRAGGPSAYPGVYVASLSFRTVTYKALCAAAQLARFYPDLEDPDLAVPFAIFHQRFSTNTEPSWERAQPFRLLCHNGEINTIDGNVTWTEARERARGDEPALAPALDRAGRTRRSSTTRSSCSCAATVRDRARRCRCSSRRPGRTIRASTTRCAPSTATARCSASRGTARRHCASRTAATCGAALDRNGLRPLRVAVAGDELSPSPPRQGRCRCLTAPPCAGRGWGRAAS